MSERVVIKPENLKNPQKYVGKFPIVIRSRWESVFMNWCDRNENVYQWASEPWQIPYSDPITKTQKIYIPDFLLMAKNAKGVYEVMLIEIKPQHEALIEKNKSMRDAAITARNYAKWISAYWWCQRRGIKFVVMTEKELFGGS